MTTTLELTGALTSSLNWLQSETDSDTVTNTIKDTGTFNYTKNFTSGTGSGEIDTIWHTVDTLTVGGATQYDLTSLTRSLFSSSFTESFAKVKGLVLENLSTSSGANISLSCTGTNAFTGPFLGTGIIDIPAKSPFNCGNYMFGWPVSASSKLIQINDTGGSGTKYRIAVIGTA